MIDDPRWRGDIERRQPLPSEDTGDLVNEPASGLTDDYLVAREEGVAYDPPRDRVVTEPRTDQSGPDQAGTAPTDAGELERVDGVQPPTGLRPRDDELRADVIEALRDSELPAGDHLQVAVDGRRVVLRGEVESVDILDEILSLVGEVPGVDEVTDEVQVRGL
jgi:hypothetical protein